MSPRLKAVNLDRFRKPKENRNMQILHWIDRLRDTVIRYTRSFVPRLAITKPDPIPWILLLFLFDSFLVFFNQNNLIDLFTNRRNDEIVSPLPHTCCVILYVSPRPPQRRFSWKNVAFSSQKGKNDGHDTSH